MDDGLRIVPGGKSGRELVNRVHARNGKDIADRGNHSVVDLDVAFDPLGAHGKAWTAFPHIAEAVARSHASALRHGVDGNERRIGVDTFGDDTDRTPVETRIGCLLTRCEETVGVEVEPGWGAHGDRGFNGGLHTVWDPERRTQARQR